MENLYALPLAERQAAREKVHQAMADEPHTYARKLSGLLSDAFDGPVARRNIGRPNANRIARAGQMVAEKFYRCPGGWAAQAWHKLTAEQKRIIDGAFAEVLREHGL